MFQRYSIGKLIEFAQDARRTHPRESVDGDDADVLAPDARLDSAVEVFAGENSFR